MPTESEEYLQLILKAKAQSIFDVEVEEIKQALKERGRDPEAVADQVRRILLDAISHHSPEAGRDAEAQTVGAVDMLYRDYSAQLFAFLLRIVRDQSRAEDLLQETFLKAMDKLHTIREPAKTRSWLHKIAYNLAMEAGRATGRRGEIPADDALFLSYGKSDQTERRHDLEVAIGALPEEQRAVLIKHDIEGWSHAEIADIMHKNPSTVRAELSLARRRVRVNLSGRRTQGGRGITDGS